MTTPPGPLLGKWRRKDGKLAKSLILWYIGGESQHGIPVPFGGLWEEKLIISRILKKVRCDFIQGSFPIAGLFERLIMKKHVALLATAVAMFAGFSAPAMAELDPPNQIVVPKFCGDRSDWKVTWKGMLGASSPVPDVAGARAFPGTFVHGTVIPGFVGKDTNDTFTRVTVFGGGRAVPIQIPRGVIIRMLVIDAHGPGGRFWKYEFSRDAVVNKTVVGFQSDALGRCVGA